MTTDTRVERVREEYLVHLDEHDKAAAADEMAALREKLDRVDEARREAASAFKAEAEELENQLSDLARAVRSGQLREVDVEVIYNYLSGTIAKVRLDTGEMVMDRAMSPTERQRTLALVDPAPNGDDTDLDGLEGPA